jgi:gamma-glutamyl phosphate reductase
MSLLLAHTNVIVAYQVMQYVCANPTVLRNGQASVFSEALLCRLVQDAELQMSEAEVEELVVDWCGRK